MQSKEKKSGIVWPSTKRAQLSSLEKTLSKASSLAEVGMVMEAAKAVRLPVHEEIRKQIQEEANKNAHLPGKTRQRLARKERREAKEQGGNDMAWDEVNSISGACANMLRVSGGIVPMLSEKELIDTIRQQGNASLLARLVRSIVSDTRQLAADFNKIFESHKDRFGAIGEDGDIYLAHSVFSDYVNFTELTNGCLIPSLAHASEILGEGMNELQKTKPEIVARLNYESINYEFLNAKRAMENIVGANTEEAPAAEKEESNV